MYLLNYIFIIGSEKTELEKILKKKDNITEK